jgi:hypothetical protein
MYQKWKAVLRYTSIFPSEQEARFSLKVSLKLFVPFLPFVLRLFVNSMAFCSVRLSWNFVSLENPFACLIHFFPEIKAHGE